MIEAEALVMLFLNQTATVSTDVDKVISYH
ncbi:hypothetical protein FHS70_004714 [Flammeovirga yaeyamensis]|nr:hypothetical protein [Flammeovirga yaeyamensis]